MGERRKLRLLAAGSCVFFTLVCLAYGWFRSDLDGWWLQNAGGVPWVLFFITFFFALFPKPRYVTRICLAVVSVTCLIEVAQLWNPEPIASFRGSTVGAALLGATFAWSDIAPYLIGGIFGVVWLRLLVNLEGSDRKTLASQ